MSEQLASFAVNRLTKEGGNDEHINKNIPRFAFPQSG